MDTEALKHYIKGGHKTVTKCLEQLNAELLLAARLNKVDTMERVRKKMEILEAVGTYIESLYDNFPELKE